MNRSKFKTAVLALSASIIAISLIAFPQESIDASIRGLNLWWKNVFPSLLPFLIMSEILISFGVVQFIGVLLEPFMRPLFKVPGVGGFVWAMGMASGFPAGAKLTAKLREEGELSKVEAERLVSFTNCSNPLFIFGAVSVTFFHNARLGIILALAHYLGNMTVGLLMRFYGKEHEKGQTPNQRRFSLVTAFSELHKTRINEKRPLGKLLGDAVMSSIQTLLMVGGFIVLFSVINKLLLHLHIIEILAEGLGIFLQLLNFPEALSIPFISGLFEITLGSQLTSQVQQATLMQQVIMTSFILAFNGFSIHAQVASILAQTDIKFKPFFFARFFHGFFASVYAYLLWTPVYERFYGQNDSDSTIAVSFFGENSWISETIGYFNEMGPLITIGALTIYILIYLKRIIPGRDI